jgi:hypothetical protein
MALSLAMIVLQAILTVALILAMKRMGWPPLWQATGPAIALMLALGFAAVAKAGLLKKLLGHPVVGWRWTLVPAAIAALLIGQVVIRLPEWAEIALGIPAILATFGLIIWTKGFGPEDRELFRMRGDDVRQMTIPDPSASADAPR